MTYLKWSNLVAEVPKQTGHRLVKYGDGVSSRARRSRARVLSFEGRGNAIGVHGRCRLGFSVASAFPVIMISGLVSSSRTASVVAALGCITESGSPVIAEWDVGGELAGGMVLDGMGASLRASV